MQNLSKFLLDEIQKRQTSITKFAKEAGVSTQTIANIINGEGDYPRIQTLISIAEYTGVSVNHLFSLTVGQDAVRAEAYILAQRIVELPPEKQKLIFEMLSGVLKQANSGT